MMSINLSLRRFFSFFAAFCVALIVASAALHAQPAPPAMPVTPVEEEKLPVLGKAPIVVELFTSQACVFCPKADQLFGDLLKQENVIGISCHIDYLDVKTGSLSKHFCTERQSWYMEKFFAGPNYTPQMVINGTIDVVGYKFQDVVGALRRASVSEVVPLEIVQTSAVGTYKVNFPREAMDDPNNFKLWLALYDKPHEVTIADGSNQGRKETYYHVVSELGSTDKLTKEVYVTPPMTAQHEGFVVILQNMKTGRIHAIGQHKAAS